MEEYQENCIHLKACRRLCKIFKKSGRGCNEYCTAYENETQKRNAVLEVAREYSYMLDDDYGYQLIEDIEEIIK